MKVLGNVAGKGVYAYIDTESWLGPWITANSRGLPPYPGEVNLDLVRSHRPAGGSQKATGWEASAIPILTMGEVCICHPSTASTNLCLDRWSPPPSPPTRSISVTDVSSSGAQNQKHIPGGKNMRPPPPTPPPLGFKGERGSWADVRTGRDGRFYKRYGNAERDGHFYHRNILLRRTAGTGDREGERETERRTGRNGSSW